MTSSSSLKVLAGTHGSDLSGLLSSMSRQPAWQPFDARLIAFVSKLSQLMLTSPGIREFPELAALGHWFRKARLLDLAKRLQQDDSRHIRIGRGLAFHLAPANVDSVFMYSWLLSLLAGNCNVVRLSQKGGPQQDFVLDILNQLGSQEEYRDISQRYVLLTYAHDRKTTQAISEACMVRVIWGGDTTVQEIRSIPLRPMATELCFADRFSAAALDAAAVNRLDGKALEGLIHGFYNDTFWFGQQACSSPRLVAWVGSPDDIEKAKARFWPALRAEVSRRQSENSAGMVMARLGALFEFAGAGIGQLPPSTNLQDFPATLDLLGADLQPVREIHCGNGLFIQEDLQSLAQLGPQLSDKDQTLAVYGFTAADYQALVSALPPRALDRIVPVGEALSFDSIWDGQDFLRSLTRLISLPH